MTMIAVTVCFLLDYKSAQFDVSTRNEICNSAQLLTTEWDV